MYWASHNNAKTSKAKIIIGEGAQVDWQDEDGETPLHRACYNGNMDMMMLLIDHKADIDIIDDWGESPLYYAARRNRVSTVRALVEAGANINIRGHKNKTAAERAKEKGYHALSDYLTTEALHIRFHVTVCKESGELHRAKGRSLRAIERDLKETTKFDDHMLHRLSHFCSKKRR